MKRYKVTISYRPHVSGLRRETVEYTIEARSRQVALVRAGWIMAMDRHHHVAESINVEIEAL